MRKGNLIYKKRYFLKEFSGQTLNEIANRTIIPILQGFKLKEVSDEKIFVDHQLIRNPNFDTLFGRNVKLSVRIYQNPKDITLIIRIYPTTPNGKLLLVNWSESIFQVIGHFKHILKFKL